MIAFLPRILLSGLMLLMVVMLVLWLFAIWKKSQFSLLLKCALTLLIVVLIRLSWMNITYAEKKCLLRQALFHWLTLETNETNFRLR